MSQNNTKKHIKNSKSSFIFNNKNSFNVTTNTKILELDEDLNENQLKQLQQQLSKGRSQLQTKDTMQWLKQRTTNNISKKYLYYPEQIKTNQEMKNVFLKIDQDGSQSLDIQELLTMFHKYGFKITEEDIKQLFKIIDDDKNMTLSWKEFKKMNLNPRANQAFTEMMRRIRQQKNQNQSNSERSQNQEDYIPMNFGRMIAYLSYQIQRDNTQNQIKQMQASDTNKKNLDAFQKIKDLFELTQEFERQKNEKYYQQYFEQQQNDLKNQEISQKYQLKISQVQNNTLLDESDTDEPIPSKKKLIKTLNLHKPILINNQISPKINNKLKNKTSENSQISNENSQKVFKFNRAQSHTSIPQCRQKLDQFFQIKYNIKDPFQQKNMNIKNKKKNVSSNSLYISLNNSLQKSQNNSNFNTSINFYKPPKILQEFEEKIKIKQQEDQIKTQKNKQKIEQLKNSQSHLLDTEIHKLSQIVNNYVDQGKLQRKIDVSKLSENAKLVIEKLCNEQEYVKNMQQDFNNQKSPIFSKFYDQMENQNFDFQNFQKQKINIDPLRQQQILYQNQKLNTENSNYTLNQQTIISKHIQNSHNNDIKEEENSLSSQNVSHQTDKIQQNSQNLQNSNLNMNSSNQQQCDTKIQSSIQDNLSSQMQKNSQQNQKNKQNQQKKQKNNSIPKDLVKAIKNFSLSSQIDNNINKIITKSLNSPKDQTTNIQKECQNIVKKEKLCQNEFYHQNSIQKRHAQNLSEILQKVNSQYSNTDLSTMFAPSDVVNSRHLHSRNKQQFQNQNFQSLIKKQHPSTTQPIYKRNNSLSNLEFYGISKQQTRQQQSEFNNQKIKNDNINQRPSTQQHFKSYSSQVSHRKLQQLLTQQQPKQQQYIQQQEQNCENELQKSQVKSSNNINIYNNSTQYSSQIFNHQSNTNYNLNDNKYPSYFNSPISYSTQNTWKKIPVQQFPISKNIDDKNQNQNDNIKDISKQNQNVQIEKQQLIMAKTINLNFNPNLIKKQQKNKNIQSQKKIQQNKDYHQKTYNSSFFQELKNKYFQNPKEQTDNQIKKANKTQINSPNLSTNNKNIQTYYKSQDKQKSIISPKNQNPYLKQLQQSPINFKEIQYYNSNNQFKDNNILNKNHSQNQSQTESNYSKKSNFNNFPIHNLSPNRDQNQQSNKLQKFFQSVKIPNKNQIYNYNSQNN